ncbi:MAG: transporter, fusion family protein, partial [Deltaproteobacteria bacterium]|nr:transporter, fusion family protein [Deltaproteobacteria bacterium]
MAEKEWTKTDFVYKEDDAKVQSLVESFDPEMRFRALKGLTAKVVLIMCLILSIFHIYTAGFGVLQEWKHRCFHFSFVLALVFLVFPTRKVKVKNLTTTWIYEILFCVMSGAVLALSFQNVLKLQMPVTWL